MLYKAITTLSYTIDVRLSSVVVATAPTSSNWTEQFRQTAGDTVDANNALRAISTWASSTDLLPQYDHLMVFTGYDLTKYVGFTTSDSITGLAYTGTLCYTNGKASSIVEDLGGFQCIGTAAHELGHGLSAEHDGTNNLCSSSDRYIMAATSSEVTPSNKLNPWKFSACSVYYFNTFLNNQVQNARGRTCLYNNLNVSSDIPDVTSQQAGQFYDADAQCRQYYGSSSRLCRGPEFGNASDVCTSMYCYDPSTISTCYQLVAARGTTCGNRKWCESGQCVFNSAAPAVDENCVFGEQSGVAFNNEDCTTFVDKFPGYCYQEVVRVRCCQSCARHYQLVKGCEYGNRAGNCYSSQCSFYDQGNLENCCGTCNYGTTFTTTTTPIPTTTTSVTTTSAPTTRVTTGVVVSPETTVPADTTTGACADNSSVLINGLSCSALVSGSPSFCYRAQVIAYCCRSCQLASTGVTGCEFGDRGSSCDAIQPNSDACRGKKFICCKTCAGYVEDESPTGGAKRSHSADVAIYVITIVTYVTLAQSFL
ncbi:metalloprotease mig-17-like isoform X2 [Babylonia areolata]|uniref:metalloprotease mig-17-like isoform X2 n=1 Tax=Babylonia areolata TaxID=304850 RepID=UPI003FD2E595